MSENISIKKAAMINAIAKYSVVALQLIYTAVLSRILSAQEFGIVAVVNVFIAFFQIFVDMGFGPAIIQNKSLNEDDVNNIFSFCIYIGILLTAIFIGASYPISFFYNNSIYISLGLMLSFSLSFNTFSVVPNAILMKEKRFISVSIRTIVCALVSFAVSIVLAVKGFGVYALVANTVLNAFLLFCWNEISVKCRFRFLPKVESIKKVFSYSSFQLLAQTLNYFNRNLDNLLIGKFFSEEELGYYSKSYSLMMYPVHYLPGVISPILHPIYADHQDDSDFIYNSYLKLLRFLSLLGVFGTAFCFLAGREIILIAFGDKWEPSIIPFKILCLSLWFQILSNTTGPIYQSLGNTKLMFVSCLFSSLVIVSCIIGGILCGDILYVSIFVLAAYVITFFSTFFFLIKLGFKYSVIKFVWSFKFDILIFVVLMLISVFYPLKIDNKYLSFLIKFLILFSIYVTLLFITKQHRIFVSILRRHPKNEKKE